MRKRLADHSFQVAIVITLLFFGAGITFMLLRPASYGWMMFVLRPSVLGISPIARIFQSGITGRLM